MTAAARIPCTCGHTAPAARTRSTDCGHRVLAGECSRCGSLVTQSISSFGGETGASPANSLFTTALPDVREGKSGAFSEIRGVNDPSPRMMPSLGVSSRDLPEPSPARAFFGVG